MPIIVQTTSADQTTTVQQILNCVSQDVRGVLNPTTGITAATDKALLIDYTNRISLDLLRHARWTFLLSAPLTFTTTATATGVTSPQNNLYWLGATGQAPAGTVDTTLNLSDFDIMKRDEVIDYTNFKRLANSTLQPISQQYTLPAKPRIWTILPSAPNVLQLWPAPVGAYTITFRYFKVRAQLTDVTQVIQIPDRYKDIVCNGVTWLAFQYLKSYPEDVQQYEKLYQVGKTQIIKDMNLQPQAEAFIRPDASAVVRQTTSGVGLDSGLETSIP